jgi:hypothetical protein
MRSPLRGAGLVLLLAAACAREKTENRRALPAGDAVWFSGGLGSGEAEAEVEAVLARGAFAHVLLPAVRLRPEAVGAPVALPAPGRPLASRPVLLVVESAGGLENALSSGAADGLATSIGDALQPILRDRSAWGNVEGVHLDLPFSPATSEGFGALVAKLRERIPADLFLTCSLAFAPAEKGRDELVRQLSASDGLVAFVFEDGARADPIATDALGKPWWAGYRPSARGQWRDGSGASKGTLAEESLSALTDDNRASLEHDLALAQEGVSGFVFRLTTPIQAGGKAFAPGDRVDFAQPAVSELLYRFGSDLAGRRSVRGRVIVLDGTSDSERIFTLSALSDALLGRPLLPELTVSVETDGQGIRVTAENRSSHASVISRTANWVEVDVPSGQIRDVQLGGFDRYEVYDPQGRPVTPGRATRVRFFETLLAPRERIEGAAILLWGRPPAGCCRFRQHALAASGTELAGEWTAPPPPPTPTPGPKKAKPWRR